MRTSTADQHGHWCPQCGDAIARDLIGRGFVRHKSYPNCLFERGQRDDVESSTASTDDDGSAESPVA